jgi:hypothetical protein
MEYVNDFWGSQKPFTPSRKERKEKRKENAGNGLIPCGL